jgi:hypothetical protein
MPSKTAWRRATSLSILQTRPASVIPVGAAGNKRGRQTTTSSHPARCSSVLCFLHSDASCAQFGARQLGDDRGLEIYKRREEGFLLSKILSSKILTKEFFFKSSRMMPVYINIRRNRVLSTSGAFHRRLNYEHGISQYLLTIGLTNTDKSFTPA